MEGKRYFLKPCPFCGGKPYLERHHRAFINAKTTRVALVRCTICEARSPRFELALFGTRNHSETAEWLAVEAWNRRRDEEAGETSMD